MTLLMLSFFHITQSCVSGSGIVLCQGKYRSLKSSTTKLIFFPLQKSGVKFHSAKYAVTRRLQFRQKSRRFSD